MSQDHRLIEPMIAILEYVRIPRLSANGQSHRARNLNLVGFQHTAYVPNRTGRIKQNFLHSLTQRYQAFARSILGSNSLSVKLSRQNRGCRGGILDLPERPAQRQNLSWLAGRYQVARYPHQSRPHRKSRRNNSFASSLAWFSRYLCRP